MITRVSLLASLLLALSGSPAQGYGARALHRSPTNISDSGQIPHSFPSNDPTKPRKEPLYKDRLRFRGKRQKIELYGGVSEVQYGDECVRFVVSGIPVFISDAVDVQKGDLVRVRGTIDDVVVGVRLTDCGDRFHRYDSSQKLEFSYIRMY